MSEQNFFERLGCIAAEERAHFVFLDICLSISVSNFNQLSMQTRKSIGEHEHVSDSRRGQPIGIEA
jgi:hypothetical protein